MVSSPRRRRPRPIPTGVRTGELPRAAPTVLADIYALAATVYALLTGRPPSFGTDGRVSSLMTIRGQQRKSPGGYRVQTARLLARTRLKP